MRLKRLLPIAALQCALLALCAAVPARAETVAESARKIPVAYDVDVVVVGGGSGAVAAATAAAQSGAKVFLAAPRPYLGEDICAPMRLWLEAGETPQTELARTIFSEKGLVAPASVVPSLKFSYTTDIPSSPKHRDTKVPSKLGDGLVNAPEKNSVQYDGDVTITADLGSSQSVKEARLLGFNRADAKAKKVTVQVSDDGKTWMPVPSMKTSDESDEIMTVSAALGSATRFVRFKVERAEGATRLLLGEIALIPDGQPDPKPLDTPKPRGPYRPMYVKKALDDALLAAGVKYLYGSQATDVLRDAKGEPCGIVMANRAGRQAVRAKVIIDATQRAAVARMAGAKFQPYPAGEQEFKYVAIGGPVKTGEGIAARKLGLSYGARDFAEAGGKDPIPGAADMIEYTLRIPMADGSYASFARAEQIARDKTWDLGIQFNTDEIFQVPPDAMQGVKAGAGAWEGVEKLALEPFQPAGVSRMYVLGGCADVPREQAERLVRPVAQLSLGERIGKAAAEQAKGIAKVEESRLPATAKKGRKAAEVKEILGGVRPTDKRLPTVESGDRDLPVLGSYDVVVIGGGTGGAPAAISAARAGAKTLLVEYLHGLGGVGTLGLISSYYHGYLGGFTGTMPFSRTWNPLEKSEWLRAELRKSGGDLWYGSIGCGAVVEKGRVKGVILATPQGRGVVRAKAVIDATGNSDIAAAAGARTIYVDGSEPTVQGTGLPPIKPGSRGTNTDFTIIDDSDAMDVWHVLVYAKSKYEKAFDLGQLVDTRERRRIIGDFFMTLPDEINERTYPDTINIARSNFDTHGMTVEPYLLMEHPERRDITVNVPLRCLLPKGLEGIMVTGLGVSAHRDAMPLIRMQPDIQNQGYAAGMIAAESARSGLPIRKVDLKPIQKRLVELQILPPEALNAKDSYPLPDERIAEAVKTAKDGHGLAVIITHQEKAMPLLRQAYASATGEDKVAYARILAILHDPAGVDTLMQAIDKLDWDKGWNYTGMGQFGSSLSPVDTMLVALARTGDKRCLPAIVKKAATLDEKSDFSHFRAVALSLEMLRDPAGVEPLARLLALPGLQGYAVHDPAQAAQLSGPNPNDNSTRQTAVRELTLGRALYRCGDKDGLGKKILGDYATDLRGFMAQHAQAVLEGK